MSTTILTLSLQPPSSFDPTLIPQIQELLAALGVTLLSSSYSNTNTSDAPSQSDLDALPPALQARLLKMGTTSQSVGYELVVYSIKPADSSGTPVSSIERIPFPSPDLALEHGEALLDNPLHNTKIEVHHNGSVIAAKSTARDLYEIEYINPITEQHVRVSNIASISAVLRMRKQIDQSFKRILTYTVNHIRPNRTLHQMGTMTG